MDGALITGAALWVVAFFWIVLPLGVLAAALRCGRRSAEPGSRLCAAADTADPSRKPCWAPIDADYCDRHLPATSV